MKIVNKNAKDILLINGANLNLLGKREPEIYGRKNLESTVENLKKIAEKSQKIIVDLQSNHEGEIIDFIHTAIDRKESTMGIIINPGAFTHTSVGIRDALLAVDFPIVEVHISNIFCREKFRHHSYISDISCAVISGLGIYGYEVALNYFLSNSNF